MKLGFHMFNFSLVTFSFSKQSTLVKPKSQIFRKLDYIRILHQEIITYKENRKERSEENETSPNIKNQVSSPISKHIVFDLNEIINTNKEHVRKTGQ